MNVESWEVLIRGYEKLCDSKDERLDEAQAKIELLQNEIESLKQALI
jgi:peptidoglycan hydrolase CwlO-like protein